MHHRTSVRMAALGAAGATALFAAPAAFAATGATTSAPLQISSTFAHQESHGLHALRRNGSTVTSTNWSGYAATGSSGEFTSVSSSWVQPTVTCGSKTTYSSYWVGIDGYSNSALEQTGTEADCVRGRAEYGAWWEVLPASETDYSVTVEPGDSLTASVVDNGNGTFTMKLSDSTRGWSKTTTADGSSGYQDSSAEVIAEATTVGGSVAKLSDFGTVSFSGSTVDGGALSGYSPNEIVMQNGSDTLAQPAALSGGSFSDTWENYS
jgi:hypothetical protein